VNWVVLESKMCNKMLHGVNIASYDVSSLKQVVIDSGIKHKTYASLMNLLPHVSVIKVYSTYTRRTFVTSIIMLQQRDSASRKSLISGSFQV